MHCHSAPIVPRPHPFTATRPRACRFGTLTPVWQSRSHCHLAPSVPRPHPFTATRPRAYRFGMLTPVWQPRSHCHSALNVQSSTFTGEWQCRRVTGCPIVSRNASMWAEELRFVLTAMWVGRYRRRGQGAVHEGKAVYCPRRAYTFFRCAYMSLICGDPVAVAEVIGVGCVRTREEKGLLT